MRVDAKHRSPEGQSKLIALVESSTNDTEPYPLSRWTSFLTTSMASREDSQSNVSKSGSFYGCSVRRRTAANMNAE